ncbi:MAG TPA: hypothetical protein VGB73_08420 [Pyrinomonadaceae bacterium]|jgi:hypothetical protein
MNRRRAAGAAENFSTFGEAGTAARNIWVRPGMAVTFRAELMPGRVSSERTFRVTQVLPSLRVRIEGMPGEHAAGEFESI